jgi:hypothetical protein
MAAVAVMRAFMAVLQFCSAAVSIFTSACCASRLARGNAQEQTHSETSSNYLCTNDELGNGRNDPKSSAKSTARRGTPRRRPGSRTTVIGAPKLGAPQRV